MNPLPTYHYSRYFWRDYLPPVRCLCGAWMNANTDSVGKNRRRNVYTCVRCHKRRTIGAAQPTNKGR